MKKLFSVLLFLCIIVASFFTCYNIDHVKADKKEAHDITIEAPQLYDNSLVINLTEYDADMSVCNQVSSKGIIDYINKNEVNVIMFTQK